MKVALVGYLPHISGWSSLSLRKITYYLARTLLRKGCSVEVIPAFDREPDIPRSLVEIDGSACYVVSSSSVPYDAYDVVLVTISPCYFARLDCIKLFEDSTFKLLRSIRSKNPRAKLGLYGTFNSVRHSAASTAANLSKLFDFLIFYNDHDIEVYRGLAERAGAPALPHFVVTPGVDTKLYKPAPSPRERADDRLTVLCVARNILEKNLTAVIAAAAMAAEEGVKLHLTMVTHKCGFGSYGILDLSTAVENVGLKEVEFVEEFIEESRMPDVYRSADIFITLSSAEGACLPMLEAQACGLPVIAHALPALKSIYGDSVAWVGSEGVLHLPVGPIPLPSVREAAAKLVELAGDERLRRELSERGVANARRFDWDEAVGPRLEKVLEEVVD